MGTMRTPETEARYTREKQSGRLAERVLCKSPSLKEFKEWRIIENRFPYDLVAEVHHMLVPKRHASDAELTASEQEEFEAIKEAYVQEVYEFMIEPARKKRSIPDHSHLHLLIAKA